MSGPFPTKKISALTIAATPLAGNELLEIVQEGNSRHILSRDFVLPTDSLVTFTGMFGSLSGSRQLVSSATIQVDLTVDHQISLSMVGTGAVSADPTSTIGLTVVNGVATTWMRSDAAPALSQAIAPTWTGLHNFSNTVTFSKAAVGAGVSAIKLESTSPFVFWKETDAAADNGLWRMAVNSEQFFMGTRDDSDGTGIDFFLVDRTGTTVDTLYFTANVTETIGGIAHSFIYTPGAIASGTVNDYNPTFFKTSAVMRMVAGAGGSQLTGLVAQRAGFIITLSNVGADNLTIMSENAGSSANNRFSLVTDLTILPNDSMTFYYDGSSSRWRKK